MHASVVPQPPHRHQSMLLDPLRNENQIIILIGGVLDMYTPYGLILCDGFAVRCCPQDFNNSRHCTMASYLYRGDPLKLKKDGEV